MDITWGDVKSEINFFLGFPGYCLEIATTDGEIRDVVILDAGCSSPDGEPVINCVLWSDAHAGPDPESESFDIVTSEIVSFHVY